MRQFAQCLGECVQSSPPYSPGPGMYGALCGAPCRRPRMSVSVRGITRWDDQTCSSCRTVSLGQKGGTSPACTCRCTCRGTGIQGIGACVAPLGTERPYSSLCPGLPLGICREPPRGLGKLKHAGVGTLDGGCYFIHGTGDRYPVQEEFAPAGSPSIAVTCSLAWSMKAVLMQGTGCNPIRGSEKRHEVLLCHVASDKEVLQTLAVLSDHSIGQLEVPPSCLDFLSGGRTYLGGFV